MTTMRTFGRREFLGNGTRAAAAAALFGGATGGDGAAQTPGPPPGRIPNRTLGKTGLRLPILGYGGAALPKLWYNPLSREDRVALVRYA